MTKSMQAAVLHSPGHITVESVPRPVITGPGQVLLSVASCGVCGSDIPRMMKNGAHKMPLICGHEFSAYVLEISADVEGVRVGDLVTVPPLIPCLKCDLCAAGRFSLCKDYDYFGSRRDGAYAEFVVSPASNVMVVPGHLDPRAAAMVDPAAIAVHGLRRTKIQKGSRVAVVGAGPIGLFAVQWALIHGASEVLAVDISAAKADQAREAGASMVASNDAEALEFGSFDVVLESAGVPAAENLAINLVGPGGDAVFVGIPTGPVELAQGTFSRFLRQEINLHGAWNSFSAPWPGAEWRDTVDMLANGTLKWEFMITHQLGLDALPGAFQMMNGRTEHFSKVLFQPNGA